MPRVTISEPDKTPQPYRFKLERKTVHIGRGSDNDIIIQCGSVSTSHAVMERVEGGYILRDSGSTNGIKKNGSQMDVIDLFDGMEVHVGDVPLQFELGEEEIEAISEEEFTSHQKKKLPKAQKEQAPLPEPQAEARPRPQAIVTPTPMASASPGMNPMLVMILMIAAVLGGMAMRHYQDHKKMIFSEPATTEKKSDPSETEKTPEPATDTTSE